jgi:hypothetical protein
MPDLAFLDDADGWRERAEEVRALADIMSNPATKRMLRGIAETYEKLAKHAEARMNAEQR